MNAEVETSLMKVDELLRNHVANPLSLAPDREQITEFVTLGRQLINEKHSIEFCRCAISGLELIVKSQIRNFPDNIFWDYDFFCATMFGQQNMKRLSEFIASVENLMNIYGIHSVLSFQFVHDFTYGFDWARWVRKKPDQRNQTHLFQKVFLNYLTKRNAELKELIKGNDSKYHQIPGDERRNPFKFSREPEDEKIVLESLAKQNLIPVPAWETIPKTVWNHDYTRIREETLFEHKSDLQ